LLAGGTAGLVLVDVPMDKLLPPNCRSTPFHQAAGDRWRGQPSTRDSGREIVDAALRRAERAGPGTSRWRRAVGASDLGLAGARRRRSKYRSRTTLMGKGLPGDGRSPPAPRSDRFWGTPISNDRCRTADLIVAIGTRLAEANSSSWDPRFTFSIPPTRLIHIDAD
jgi:acetolactate synthase-1/2/3 large subunit